MKYPGSVKQMTLAATHICLLLSILVGSIVFMVPPLREGQCSSDIHSNFSSTPPPHTCFIDAAKGEWIKSNTKSLEAKQEAYFTLNPSKFLSGGIIETVSLEDVPTMIKKGSDEPIMLGNSSTIAGTRVVYRTTFSQQEAQNGIKIGPYLPNTGDIYFRVLTSSTPISVGKIGTPGRLNGASGYWINCLLGLLITSLALTALTYSVTHKPLWGVIALSCSFFLAANVFERPFRGMSGLIDKGDDTYYVAYAISHIEKQNLFDCKTDVVFSNSKSVLCYGLPGTSLMLESVWFVQSLVKGSPFYTTFNLDILKSMRIASASYAFATTIILFLTLRLFGINALNILLPASLLWSTSLWKWSFDRSIFTHAPELFLNSLLLFVMSLASKNKVKPLAAAIIAPLILGLLVLVRGEYLFLYLLIPLFLYKNVSAKLSAYLAYSCVSAACLFNYKYFADVIGAYAKGKEPLILRSLNNLWEWEFYVKYWSQLQSMSASITAWGSLLYIGLLSLAYLVFIEKRKDFFTLGALIFFTFYFVLTSLFHTPLGLEIGHRYLLKLYPFCFIAIQVHYGQADRKSKVLFLSVLAYSCFTGFVQTNEIINESEMVTFERFQYLMSDSQLIFHGFIRSYYRMYAFAFAMLVIPASALYTLLLFRNLKIPKKG